MNNTQHNLESAQPTDTKPKKRGRIIIYLLLVAVLMGAGMAGVGYWYLTSPAVLPANKTVLFTVNKGSGLNQIAKDLKRAGLIEYELAFVLAARLQGTATALKAGEYSLILGMSVWELSRMLKNGRTNLYPVVLPEGFNMAQIIERLSSPIYAAEDRPALCPVDKNAAWVLVYDQEFVASLGIKGNSLEGYLFPDTYNFGMEDHLQSKEVLKRMVSQFDKVWASQVNCGQQKLNRHQLVTLASIIEKETGVDAERPLVSAVYHNRLKIGMPLQADPTVVYGQGSNGPITRRQLETDHPYNTYTRPGLPPGPICSPGLASMQAACAPANVDYLYFVATGEADGSHNFARTLQEHLKNVSQYRQRVRGH